MLQGTPHPGVLRHPQPVREAGSVWCSPVRAVWVVLKKTKRFNCFIQRKQYFIFNMGIFSNLCVSVLFLFLWDGLWLLSPWLWLLILLLLLSPSVLSSAAEPSFIHRSLCLQLCHPVHPLQLFARVPRTLFWLPVPLPRPQQLPGSAPLSLCLLRNGASLFFPGLCPPPWLGAGMLSPLPLPLRLRLLPWPRLILSSCCLHPAASLAPDPLPTRARPTPSQTSATFPASFQQLFLDTRPRAALSPVLPLRVHSICCCSLSPPPSPGSSPHLSPLVLPAGMPELGHGVL